MQGVLTDHSTIGRAAVQFAGISPHIPKPISLIEFSNFVRRVSEEPAYQANPSGYVKSWEEGRRFNVNKYPLEELAFSFFHQFVNQSPANSNSNCKVL